MMNIRNLGSKECAELKSIEDICTELCLSLWFESDWYLCFESDSPEKKVPNIYFLKLVQRQPYPDVLLYFVIFTRKETSTQMFSCEYCEILTNSFFYRTPPVASVDLLFLIKNNVGWFLLKKL